MKELLKKISFDSFRILDGCGIHVLPKHYYTPVADYRWLSNHKPVWAKRAPLTGVHWDLGGQLAWLESTCKPYYSEVAGLRSYEQITNSRVGPGFGPIESQVLHCVIRATSPHQIVEIGSGMSTAVMLRATGLNVGDGKPRSQITCIEPHPKKAFHRIEGITHIEQVCQLVPSSVFERLGPGDLLFIDSSHALKTGSDVSRIYLEILPKLRHGINVHIHDIFLPYLYSPDIFGSYFDWQETALVLALLTNNERLKVLACMAGLHHDRSRELATLLTDYRPRPLIDGLQPAAGPDDHYPSSLWLKTC